MKMSRKIDGGEILSHYITPIVDNDKAEDLFMKGITGSVILYNKNNKFMTIIIPRHPNRSSYVLKIANKFFSNASISYGNKFKKSTNCLIINSLGEMSTYYQLSDIVILGGSFINMGGHNPIEPAKYNCCILTGPSIHNWQNIFNKGIIISIPICIPVALLLYQIYDFSILQTFSIIISCIIMGRVMLSSAILRLSEN